MWPVFVWCFYVDKFFFFCLFGLDKLYVFIQTFLHYGKLIPEQCSEEPNLLFRLAIETSPTSRPSQNRPTPTQTGLSNQFYLSHGDVTIRPIWTFFKRTLPRRSVPNVTVSTFNKIYYYIFLIPFNYVYIYICIYIYITDNWGFTLHL
jgi:hypothetical protein